LSSTQEEADTHIVLHALNADKLYRENKVKGRIVVKSPDTDVLVLMIHYFPQMTGTCEVCFQTGMVTSIKDLIGIACITVIDKVLLRKEVRRKGAD
jgi:hypothetical protein